MSTATLTNQILSLDYLKGLTRDTRKSEKRSSYDKAVATYRKACEKLLSVNEWMREDQDKRWKYQLVDAEGNFKVGNACEGDYIRIKSLNDNAVELYTWVTVERILEVSHDDWKSFAVRLKAANEPGVKTDITDGQKKETNTLIVERTGKKVISYIHQRREQESLQQTDSSIFSRMMSLFVAEDESTAAQNQWDALIDSMLE